MKTKDKEETIMTQRAQEEILLRPGGLPGEGDF